jgi:hypothetical protein
VKLAFKPGEIAKRVGFAGKPGLAPAGDSLFFASPKKSKQREGEPTAGPLRGSGFLGSEPKFAEPFGSPCGCDAQRRSEIGV